MDYSAEDYADLKLLLAAFKTGEYQLMRNGVALAGPDHDRFVRHLIYLEFAHARSVGAVDKKAQ